MSLSAGSDGNRFASFGYIPDFERLADAFDGGTYPRALAIGTPVRSVFNRVDECRVIWESVALPEGIYWFDGIADGPLVLQVADGALPGDAATVALNDLEHDHPLAAARDWAEHYWDAAATVPSPAFEVDQHVVMHPGDHDVVIRDRKFLSQQWSYTVVVEGRQLDVVEARLKELSALDDPRTWVTGEPTPACRFGATLTRAKLQGKFANTLFSFRATRTTFRPYQFKPVLKLLQTGKARLLIADEVGLGKTIEAGLIWTELEARQEADRVLIVCPSSLLTKWKEEMEDRFEFEMAELDGRGLTNYLERLRQNRLPDRHAYICSLERLRIWEGINELSQLTPQFDLVIVDEAHSMRNQDTKSYALGAEIADWADNLVFLTATPINLGQSDLLNLLDLLAPGDFSDLQDLELRLEPNAVLNSVAARLLEKNVDGNSLVAQLDELKSFALGGALMQRPDFALLTALLAQGDLSPRDIVDAKRYLAELNTLSTVITRTKKIEVDDRKAKRTERRQTVLWTDEEIDFYEEYLTWCKARAREIGLPLYFAMQMPLRLASACLPMARRAVLNPVSFGKIDDADSEESSGRLEPHPELVAAARRLPESADTKFDLLTGVLREFHRGNKRALLFTFSVPTLGYLADRLGAEFSVAVMHGGVSREQRRRIMADFRAGDYDFVLANRVASEGLDFEFCSAVINYDLPWNPMEIEQRIGRIDRIGQPEELILVVNFTNDKTIDERIMVRLLERIKIFESSIGALEPILSTSAPKALQAGFDFSLTAEQQEQKVLEVLTAIEEQRKGLQDVTDASSALLVSNDVDVAGLEDDLIRTGRYVGQRELALLLDDWARIDGAPGIRYGTNDAHIEFYGNPEMAARVDQLSSTAKRTRAETAALSSQLRNEMPIPLVLDQELSRRGGGTLLTATSPLVMAATALPGHRQARFASLRLQAPGGDVVPGVYVVVLAKAVSASRSGDEIWGAAVTANGQPAGDGPVNALLAALAEGILEDGTFPPPERLPALAEKALNRLSLRHSLELAKRESEFHAVQKARKIAMEDQHRRRVETIETRIATAQARGRDQRSIALFQSQRRRAHERYNRLVSELELATPPELQLEPLAASVVQFVL